MNTQILWAAVAALVFLITYTFVVPALMSVDNALCVLFGTLILIIPLVGAIIYFVEIYRETHDEQ